VARYGSLRLRPCGPVVFTADGKHIVTGSGQRGTDVVFWDRRTGQAVRRLPLEAAVHHLLLSPNGKLLAAVHGGYRGGVVCDVEQGQMRFTFKGEHAVFTRDGRYVLAIDFTGETHFIGLWEVASGKKVRTWAAPVKTRWIVPSPDGKTMAYPVADGVALYDLEKQTETQRWSCPQMLQLTFSPDGERLAAAGLRGVRLWQIASGQEEFQWEYLADSEIVFTPDSKRLAWTGYDRWSIGSPWVLDVGQAQPRRLGFPVNNLASLLALSPDGKTLAVNTDANTLELRDVATGTEALSLDANSGRVFDLALSPDGRYLTTSEHFRELVWDRQTGKVLRRSAIPRFARYDPAGEITLTATAVAGKVVTVRTTTGALKVRDLATGKELLRLECESPFADEHTSKAAVSADGRTAAILGQTGIGLFDLTTGNKTHHYLPPHAVEDIRFSHDGRQVRITMIDWKKGLFDVTVDTRTGQEATSIRLITDRVTARGGHWPIFIEPQAQVRLSELPLKDSDGKPAYANVQGTVMDVVESADGRYLAVRQSTAPPGGVLNTPGGPAMITRVWDTKSGRQLFHVQLPPDQQLVLFSPDSRLYVTTSSKGHIGIGELATGRERLQLRGHWHESVRSVLFTPDQRQLISGGDDTQVLLWDLSGRAADGVWHTVRHDRPKQLELWNMLQGKDDGAAQRAIWELVADPEGSVPFLATLLKPVTAPDAAEIARLIEDLGTDVFGKRAAAQSRLRKIGEPAVPALRAALGGSPPLEQSRRLEKLIQELAPAALEGDPLRRLRSLEVLERIGSVEARRLLNTLAQGQTGARYTAAAKDALGRLETR
jgi:WD40 repeat protein